MAPHRNHLHDQTKEEHKRLDGLGTALFFQTKPVSFPQKTSVAKEITYQQAQDRFADAYGFKWVPHSVMTYEQMKQAAGSCDGKACAAGRGCPGSCYCAGDVCNSLE
jgi:hypothetical protein